MKEAWLLPLFSSQDEQWGENGQSVTLFVSQGGWWEDEETIIDDPGYCLHGISDEKEKK